MGWFEGARARFNLLFARHAAESRTQEEIAFHIDMETDRLIREEGLERDEAGRRARVNFGGVTQHREVLREGRGLAWLGGLSLDAKLALRMLVKHPALTVVAVIGMAVAVAIGAVSFSAVYTLVDGTLPVSEGDRVIAIRNIDPRNVVDGRATQLHDLPVWRQSLTTVEEIAAYRVVDRNLITADGRSESAHIAEMTASGFRIGRVPPLMGRYFNDEDERAAAPPVVVIGYELWQTRFIARPDIVGQVIQIGDTRYTVIGVMPQGFALPVNNRVWAPLRLNASDYERGAAPAIDVFARLAKNATIDDVRRQMATINHRLAATYPAMNGSLRARVVPYTRIFIDSPESAWTYHLVQVLVTMLLVVIGTNVAILVYARTASRMGEIAVRTALGASRSRVVVQLFAEALALSLIAAVVGLLVAHFALRTIDAAIMRIGEGQFPYWMRLHVTPGVVLYAIGLAVLGAVVVGVVPGLKATRHDVRVNLQQLSAGSSGMRLGKTWTFLIIAQVTVAVAVLPLAIAGIAAWKRTEKAEARAATKHILTATVFLDRPDSQFAARYMNVRADFVDRVQSEPGVVSIAFASNAPEDEQSTRIEVDAATAPRAKDDTLAVSAGDGSPAGVTRVDPRYFGVMDIPILAGRPFQSGDFSTTAGVAIVNRSFVRKFLGGGNPLGRRLRPAMSRADTKAKAKPPAPWDEIIGVVPDFPVDSGTLSPKIYRPLLPTSADPATMVVRLKGLPPAPFTTRLRELAVATNPMLRLDAIKTLEQTVHDSNAPQSLAIVALELVTMSTVLLSAAGIYALMAFTITRRRREIGIRSALGAGPRRVLMSVLSQVAAQVSVGMIIGISIAAVFDHLLEGGYTGRRGALVLPGVLGLMMTVGLIAAIGPASRALRIQPTEALKAD